MVQVETLWLACGVLPGFRPEERRVEIERIGAGSSLLLPVDARLVRSEDPPRNGNPVAGHVCVLIFAWKAGTALVIVPGNAGLVEVAQERLSSVPPT